MSGIQRIFPAGYAKPAGHYSPGTSWNGLLFVSGQLPVPPSGELPLDGQGGLSPFATQARQALQNLVAVIASGESSTDRVLKVTAWIVGIENWGPFNAIFAEVFGDARPARAVVPVPALHHGFLVEIDAIAVCAQTQDDK